jgi:hypothetical protein
MSVIEKVHMFLYTLALGASYRKVQERFQHSDETVSKYFNKVLWSMCLLAVEIIKSRDLKFSNTPWEITMNSRYIPHFKVIVM